MSKPFEIIDAEPQKPLSFKKMLAISFGVYLAGATLPLLNKHYMEDAQDYFKDSGYSDVKMTKNNFFKLSSISYTAKNEKQEEVQGVLFSGYSEKGNPSGIKYEEVTNTSPTKKMKV